MVVMKIPDHIQKRKGLARKKKKKRKPRVEHGDRETPADEDIPYYDGTDDYDETREKNAYRNGGYMRVQLGESFPITGDNKGRYRVEKKLGCGHFSTVWLATDTSAEPGSSEEQVALKIQKSAPRYAEAAEDEIKLLTALRTEGEEKYCVQLLDHFEIRVSSGRHIVMVFEVLGQNLLDFIKQYRYKGLPLAIAKKITRECLIAFDHLHANCKIIHTDLKPENVMVTRVAPFDMEVVRLQRDVANRKMKEFELQKEMDLVQNSTWGNPGSGPKLTKTQRKRKKAKIKRMKASITELIHDEERRHEVIKKKKEQKLVKKPRRKVNPLSMFEESKKAKSSATIVETSDQPPSLSTPKPAPNPISSVPSHSGQSSIPSKIQMDPPPPPTALTEKSRRRPSMVDLPHQQAAVSSSASSTGTSIKEVETTYPQLPPEHQIIVSASIPDTDTLQPTHSPPPPIPSNLQKTELEAVPPTDESTQINSNKVPTQIDASTVPAVMEPANPSTQNLPQSTKGTAESKEEIKVEDSDQKTDTQPVKLESHTSVPESSSKDPSDGAIHLGHEDFSTMAVPDDLDEERFPLGTMLVFTKVKLADLGNACWFNKHFTSDITTRQYRAPETILGQEYDHSVDIFSLGCMLFELVTGDYLFNPKEDKRHQKYTRNDDHIAQMIELCGPFPEHMKKNGKYVRTFFNSKGELRNIQKLEYWPLECVLTEKYKMSKDQATTIQDFLTPMLRLDRKKRASAAECLKHPWLVITKEDKEALISFESQWYDSYLSTMDREKKDCRLFCL